MELQTITSYTEPEDVSVYQYINFAKQNFQGNSSYCHKKGSLKTPLLYHENPMHREAALTVNAVIQRFMMDLPEPKNLEISEEENVFTNHTNNGKGHYPGKTFNRKAESVKEPTWASLPQLSSMSKPTTNMQKVHFISSFGIFIPELRDEIYCQLCTQLINNPSGTSAKRGWILMGLLVGVFPPSDKFLNYLRCFLRDGPEGCDEFCTSRLRRTVANNNRKQTPTWIEMQAVVRKTVKIVLPVTLMDGVTHDCEVDPAMSCKELCEYIKNKIGLKNVFGFSIFATAIDQITNWGSGEESVFDAVSLAEQYLVYKGRPESDTKSWRLYMRKNVFLPSHNPANDPVETNLIYSQILGGLHLGEYNLTKTNELVDIIAKRYYIEHGATLDSDELRAVVCKTAPEGELQDDPRLEDDLMADAKGSFATISCVRNASTRESVKQEIVSEGLKRWVQSFSKTYPAILISGPKVPIGHVSLDVNAAGVMIQSAPDMGDKPFILSLEYAHLTEVTDTSPHNKKSSRDIDSRYLVTFWTDQKKAYTVKAVTAVQIRHLVLQLMDDFKLQAIQYNNN